METYGILTQANNGTFSLPLIAEYTRPKEVTISDVVYGRDVWKKWSNGELVNAGMVRINDVTAVPKGEERNSSFSDSMNDNIIERTYGTDALNGATVKLKLFGRVNGKRDSIVMAGIEVTIRDTSYVIQTDDESRKLLTGAMAAAAANHTLPEGFSWRMRDNQDVTLNIEETKAIAGTVFDHVNDAHVAARVHKESIEALTTWAEVDAYDLDAGWPDVAPEDSP